jgi:hypothetical protein
LLCIAPLYNDHCLTNAGSCGRYNRSYPTGVQLTSRPVLPVTTASSSLYFFFHYISTMSTAFRSAFAAASRRPAATVPSASIAPARTAFQAHTHARFRGFSTGNEYAGSSRGPGPLRRWATRFGMSTITCCKYAELMNRYPTSDPSGLRRRGCIPAYARLAAVSPILASSPGQGLDEGKSDYM